jgi:hypothetical protein
LSEKRVILIAPDDVGNELVAISAVIEQANMLNRRERLVVWNWPIYSTPSIHSDARHVLTSEQVRVGDADLVIAVFWSRLGALALNDESGIPHELRIAWQAWKTTRKPDLFLYFCRRPVPQTLLEDPNQFQKLRAFRSSLPKDQAYFEFDTVDDLQRQFARHLGTWLASTSWLASTTHDGSYKYDVCLSFAGEQRQYVERVAEALTRRGIQVFYDGYQTAALWGRNLYEHLDEVYQTEARYCVLFISADYASKVWTSHERKSAQARALREKEEYILPARFDDTQIPGILETIAYVDLRTITADELVNLIVAKVRPDVPLRAPSAERPIK